MASGIDALVLGAGYFGRHHARILSMLNAKGVSCVPVIDNLIVTRTHLRRAEILAESIAKSGSCSVKKVIGAEVGNMPQLVSLLQQYRPSFISITARDRDQGDSIHAAYSVQALKYGAVLCEKPFSRATGDGRSLRYFKKLYAFENSRFFGLELPLAAVGRDMMKDRNLSSIMRRAGRLDFYWEAWDRGDNRIIDDLVLHPWSLIPSDFATEIRRVEDGETRADLSIDLHHLIKLNQPLEQAALTELQAQSGEVILTVDNPLEQNIVAALSHRPIVGLQRTYESQLFLEALHGFRATQADMEDIPNP